MKVTSSFYKVRDEVFCKKVKQVYYVLSRDKKKIYKLNSTAGFIWENLKKPITLDSIVRKVVKSFLIDSKNAYDDSKGAVEFFLKENLIKKSSPKN